MKNIDRWAEIDPNDMRATINLKTKKSAIDKKNKRSRQNSRLQALNNPFYSPDKSKQHLRTAVADKFEIVND